MYFFCLTERNPLKEVGSETLHLLRLFLGAFTQVTLVACNTWQISREYSVGAGFVGFLISWVWVSNIRKIVISGERERFFYALGAGSGTVFGMNLARILYSL